MSGGTHLILAERERLAALKAEGLSLRAIAERLGRAASTISRELRRNALPSGGYLPVHAGHVTSWPLCRKHGRRSAGSQAIWEIRGETATVQGWRLEEPGQSLSNVL